MAINYNTHRQIQEREARGYQWLQSGVPPVAVTKSAGQITAITWGTHRDTIQAIAGGFQFFQSGVPPARAAAPLLSFYQPLNQPYRAKQQPTAAKLSAAWSNFTPSTSSVPLLAFDEPFVQPYRPRRNPTAAQMSVTWSNFTPAPPPSASPIAGGIFVRQEQPSHPAPRRLSGSRGPDTIPPLIVPPIFATIFVMQELGQKTDGYQFVQAGTPPMGPVGPPQVGSVDWGAHRATIQSVASGFQFFQSGVPPTPAGPVFDNVASFFQPLSQPTYKRGLKAPYDPAIAWNTLTPAPPSGTSEDRWHQPLSQPYPARRGLGVADQLAFVAPVSESSETVTVDRWLIGLSEPIRVRPRTPDAATAIPPQQPVQIQVPQGWYEPLSNPTTRRATVLPQDWSVGPLIDIVPPPVIPGLGGFSWWDDQPAWNYRRGLTADQQMTTCYFLGLPPIIGPIVYGRLYGRFDYPTYNPPKV